MRHRLGRDDPAVDPGATAVDGDPQQQVGVAVHEAQRVRRGAARAGQLGRALDQLHQLEVEVGGGQGRGGLHARRPGASGTGSWRSQTSRTIAEQCVSAQLAHQIPPACIRATRSLARQRPRVGPMLPTGMPEVGRELAVVGPVLERDDPQQPATPLRQPVDGGPQPVALVVLHDLVLRRALSRKQRRQVVVLDRGRRGPSPCATRQASRRAVVVSQPPTATGSRIAARRRTSASQVVWMTSSATSRRAGRRGRRARAPASSPRPGRRGRRVARDPAVEAVGRLAPDRARARCVGGTADRHAEPGHGIVAPGGLSIRITTLRSADPAA